MSLACVEIGLEGLLIDWGDSHLSLFILFGSQDLLILLFLLKVQKRALKQSLASRQYCSMYAVALNSAPRINGLHCLKYLCFLLLMNYLIPAEPNLVMNIVLVFALYDSNILLSKKYFCFQGVCNFFITSLITFSANLMMPRLTFSMINNTVLQS